MSNRGIELIAVNPAYSSIIGLAKYLRMYGLASDELAAGADIHDLKMGGSHYSIE